jgi:hypothetical protein
VAAGGSNDPTPWNNTLTVELNVIDRNDAEQTTVHESTLKSGKPRTLYIPSGTGR